MKRTKTNLIHRIEFNIRDPLFNGTIQSTSIDSIDFFPYASHEILRQHCHVDGRCASGYCGIGMGWHDDDDDDNNNNNNNNKIKKTTNPSIYLNSVDNCQ
ncbi:hypothetical protein BLOT_015334 [Blomia tropicalis]|nr:hypothetical protein BLOT_015334 [Blomia tropicalis]